MSQTRLCRDSSWGNDRNGSKLMNAKGQISLSQGLIHKNGKPSLSLKLSENSYLNKKQHLWLLNGDAKPVNSVNASNSLVWDSNCLEMSTYGTETVSPSRKKMLPMADYCLSEAEGLNYPLLRDMSSSSCVDADGLSSAYPIDLDGGMLSLESETAADKNKTADKKSKGKRKKNVNKKSTTDSASEKEDLNGNSLVISKIQSNTTTDAGRNQELQTEGMGKELDQKSCKPADSQDSTQKSRKGRKGPIVYAEDIPDYRGKEKIEDLLNFIGKSPNNDTLSKDKKKKSKKKSLHGRPCRSSAENKDEKIELLESDSTDLYPTKSLDKACCNCNNSEIDDCLGDDNGQADNSIVLNPEYSSPNSAEPFILVEKKSKKRLNANLNRPNKFAPKSPYRNRKLSSSVMHPHQPQHFHCNEKTELDSSYSDLEGSYKARRNSTGNVHMQMSTVQSITTEDSDNESWTSLPISQVSQGIQLINENSYPISYAKIAALSLPLSNSQSLNRSVPCSVSKTGENVPGCKETSAVVKTNSVSVIKDNQVRRTSNGNEQSCCGSDISTENSDNSANYLLKDNDNYLDRRHSVGECIANGTSVKEPKATTSTPKNLHHNKGQKENKNETKEQDISFCDHKTSSIYKNIVSGLCLSSTENGEENFNLSLNNLNKAKNFNKSKLVSHHSLVQQQQHQQQPPQQCNIYVNNSNTKCNMTDILAVKFINPRDKKHNDKQYKVTFGFFYDPDNKNGRNMTGNDTIVDSSSCPLSSELPTSLPAEPFLPKQVSNDKDEDHKKLEDRAAKPGCKEGNGVLKSSHNNKINPGDEVTGKIPQLPEANCDSTEKTVKNTEAVKCVSKLNGVVLPTNTNSLETYSLRTNETPESATISTSSTLPTTSNSKTVSPTAVDDERPRGLSNIQGNNNLHHHHTSNKKTIPDSKCGGNNGDSTVSLQFIALSYGDKIQKDNKQKVIHFRSDVADTQLFNQQEILSYLSNEYRRVCHLSGECCY
ncbi:myb-like protein U isoform X1 [Octopus bimaculoides]|uniref:myb-like protein U isoform X1 n=2 Tax=Octopus bimaculoides TaxID=37653 RepID=UPI0022E47AD7|nr:myb-like protein U isoform X1 [Octopus bimaculoides]XP_052832664.1 myb-like protein U isoform X1 [Octopus bimaculoides]XP_052832665.1 myb-like protein U isoform X1 [Octopus bimaculoides]XP_052832666.1 myb-like protein U isoform X1 [Octopus bimaculoides]XP_052832667.1 myb-like protein U isoform X1 [Octopus bimaculoides]